MKITLTMQGIVLVQVIYQNQRLVAETDMFEWLNHIIVGVIEKIVFSNTPLGGWLNLYFIRSNGWQWFFAGLFAGFFAHCLAVLLWYADKKEKPSLPWLFLITKNLSWIIIPYSVMPGNSLSILIGIYFRPYGAYALLVGYSFIRLIILLILKRRDWILNEFFCVFLEFATILPIYYWILENIYRSHIW